MFLLLRYYSTIILHLKAASDISCVSIRTYDMSNINIVVDIQPQTYLQLKNSYLLILYY